MFKAANGKSVNCLIGDRFTQILYQENSDVRTNTLDLTNEEYHGILKKHFGLHLPDSFDISKHAKKGKADIC